MGVIADTNAFIRIEKSGKPLNLSPWDSGSQVFISALTVSELLMGVHRADTEERRQRRSAFVEAVVSSVGVLDFTLGCARVHADIHAALSQAGRMIGAHDLIIAATALFHGFAVLTANVDEFSRVPGLSVIPLGAQAQPSA